MGRKPNHEEPSPLVDASSAAQVNDRQSSRVRIVVERQPNFLFRVTIKQATGVQGKTAMEWSDPSLRVSAHAGASFLAGWHLAERRARDAGMYVPALVQAISVGEEQLVERLPSLLQF